MIDPTRCPVCGGRWLLICWEWPASGRVTAEYHHHGDVAREHAGLPSHPHRMVYPVDLARTLRFGTSVPAATTG